MGHVAFGLEEFLRELPSLAERHGSVMCFMFPLRRRVVVELGSYAERGGRADRMVWKPLNFAWRTLVPGFGGISVFDQTKFITSGQVHKAFGSRVDTFRRYRSAYDPEDRLLNGFFKELLGPLEKQGYEA